MMRNKKSRRQRWVALALRSEARATWLSKLGNLKVRTKSDRTLMLLKDLIYRRFPATTTIDACFAVRRWSSAMVNSPLSAA